MSMYMTPSSLANWIISRDETSTDRFTIKSPFWRILRREGSKGGRSDLKKRGEDLLEGVLSELGRNELHT